jgi:hypothetical protein
VEKRTEFDIPILSSFGSLTIDTNECRTEKLLKITWRHKNFFPTNTVLRIIIGDINYCYGVVLAVSTNVFVFVVHGVPVA